MQLKANGLLYFETSCIIMPEGSGHSTCWINPLCLRSSER